MEMKEVKLVLPTKHKDALDDLIEDFELSCPVFSSIDNETLMCLIHVNSEKINALVNEAKKRGIGSLFGSIIISNVIIVEVEEKPIPLLPSALGVNVEEILGNLKGSATISTTYLLLTGLAAILASLGLYYNSVVTIIASMIVAPLMGPIALTSVGLIYPEKGILRQGILAEVTGLSLTVLTGAIVGFVLPRVPPTHEMSIRAVLSPDVFWFAVFSGAAAGVIISKGMDLSIVGVAIAASLAPPAANSGLLLAQGYGLEAFNAAAIVILNVLAIDFSCGLMFVLYGVTETASVSQRQTIRAKKINFLVLIVIGGLLTVIGIFIMLRTSVFPFLHDLFPQ